MNDERQVLTKAEAISMLPDGEYIHTFRNPGAGILIGADWERKSLTKALNKYECALTGEQATNMGHGMAFQDEHGWVFVKTKKAGESNDAEGGAKEETGNPCNG